MEFEESQWEPGVWKELLRVPGNHHSAVLRLHGHVDYRFRVSAINGVGRGRPSEASERYKTPPSGLPHPSLRRRCVHVPLRPNLISFPSKQLPTGTPTTSGSKVTFPTRWISTGRSVPFLQLAGVFKRQRLLSFCICRSLFFFFFLLLPATKENIRMRSGPLFDVALCSSNL